MSRTFHHLRQDAIASSLFPPMTLRRAVERLGFVQADPIRSPARAQDLILRHRVKGYRAGDLELQYRSLNLEEDFLYAYGFVPQSTWRLLHPRLDTPARLSAAEKRVLEFVAAARKQLHPRDLEPHFGREKAISNWGSGTKATTRILHLLHYRGVLRVAGRENGIRTYEPCGLTHEPLDQAERLRQLVLLVVSILHPISDSSLRAALRLVSAYGAPALRGRKPILRQLIDSGELAVETVDGIPYLRPAANPRPRKIPHETVRFLAPFDPLVWDRDRFEHLWGWAYRFEAYTPVHKRQLGYYAMPMLWRDDIIGWVNISNSNNNDLIVSPGFRAGNPPPEPAFRVEFGAEVERFAAFLKTRDSR